MLTGNRLRMQREAAEKVAARRRRKILPWEKRGLSRAERVIAFLEFLPITKGILIGRKLKLLPGQRQFIERVYGGSSDVRIAIRSEPRGNGKTGLVSGLQLCHLVGPEAEPRGECYSAAVDRQQSALMFQEMVAILEQTPDLAQWTNVRRGSQRRSIEVIGGPGVGSRYEALSGEGKRAHGLAPSFWAYDELGQETDRHLLDALMTALGKRKRSLGVILSTQAADDEHPLSQLIDDGLAGGDGTVVDLMAAPAEADVFDEAVIRACNPALGIFLSEKVVFDEARQARRLPSSESAFRNLRCNQRIAATPDLLVMPSVWAQGNAPPDPAIFTDGRPVYGGLDLSARLDLTALVLATEDDERNIHLLPIGWTPESTIPTRVQRDQAPYDVWVRNGALRSTPGLAIDYDYVVADIARATEGMNLVEVRFDRWKIDALKQACTRVGLTLPLVEFVPGWKSYSPAIEAFEVACAEGRLRHGAHPVLRWCIANTAIVRAPAGEPEKNRKPEKRRVNGRIDLAVTALMAVGALKVTAAAPEYELAALIG